MPSVIRGRNDDCRSRAHRNGAFWNGAHWNRDRWNGPAMALVLPERRCRYRNVLASRSRTIPPARPGPPRARRGLWPSRARSSASMLAPLHPGRADEEHVPEPFLVGGVAGAARPARPRGRPGRRTVPDGTRPPRCPRGLPRCRGRPPVPRGHRSSGGRPGPARCPASPARRLRRPTRPSAGPGCGAAARRPAARSIAHWRTPAAAGWRPWRRWPGPGRGPARARRWRTGRRRSIRPPRVVALILMTQRRTPVRSRCAGSIRGRHRRRGAFLLS